jgi:RNA polymerase sigma factor (sigma-70 family)
MNRQAKSNSNDELILSHAWIVGHVLYRLHRHNDDDMRSVGYVGLCEAARDYDVTMGPFRRFAYFRVRSRCMDVIKSQRRKQLAMLGERDHAIQSYRTLPWTLERSAREAKAVVLSLMQCLDCNESTLIRRLFGIGQDPVAQTVIARERGLSPGRISQYRTYILARMRMYAFVSGIRFPEGVA